MQQENQALYKDSYESRESKNEPEYLAGNVLGKIKLFHMPASHPWLKSYSLYLLMQVIWAHNI